MFYSGSDFDAWISFTDANGALITMGVANYHAVITFGVPGTGSTAPGTISDTSDPAVVGAVTLASTSPNVKLHIPKAALTAVSFRSVPWALSITDPTNSTGRWAEGTATWDRGVQY